MKLTKKTLVIAMLAAMPWLAAHAQSPADLLKQIQALQEQLKALQTQVQELSGKAVVDPVEFNHLVQQVEVKDETAKKSGFADMTVKGVIEANYMYNGSNILGYDGKNTQGFAASNGYNDGFSMVEIAKQAEGGDGVNWTLRLTPGAAVVVHEASISVPLGGDGSPRVIAGLIPDWSGYESSFSHQNPLVTHNMLFNFASATNYKGAGLQYTLGPVTLKGMLANIDTGSNKDRGVPGVTYNANWTINEYSFLNFSGAHSRQQDLNAGTPVGSSPIQPFDLMEVDAGYTHGDLTLNGQVSLGKHRGYAGNYLANGVGIGLSDDASWWGISGLVGYKLTPRMQAVARYDFLNDRSNGGGIYSDPTGGVMFGPELDAAGAVIDPNVGTTRSALSLGVNYAINPSTQFKTEVRFDQSSGYNFVDSNGSFTKTSTSVGVAVVVSF